MFADQEFAYIRDVFVMNNPELANNPEKIVAKIIEFDHDIDQILPKKIEQAIAIHILLQGRNMLARHIDSEERFIELDFNRPEEDFSIYDPSQDKYLGLYIAGNDNEMVVAAIKQTIPFEEKEYKIFHQLTELIGEILAGKLAGIIELDIKGERNIESSIRHELKNRDGWNYRKAERLILPPCANFAFDKVFWLDAMLMLKGEYNQDKKDKFDLGNSFRSLLPFIYTPKEIVNVLLVDDHLSQVEGMINILENWPNVLLKIEIKEDVIVPVIGDDIQIALLDNDMGNLSGEEVARQWRLLGYKGIIASTSGGGKVSYTPWHFQAKSIVATHQGAARNFCKFFSTLLKKLEE